MRELQVRTGLVIAVVAVLSLLVPNCGGGGDTGDAGGNPDVSTNPCGADNFKQCGGTCVDIQNDFQNCGDCGKTCPDNQVCSHGACAVVCGGGTSRCVSSCVDLKSDPLNCGGCAKACASGQVCNVGTCALTCQAGLTDCSGACVDVTSNDGNCGACGKACELGKQCVASACVASCQSGWTSCPDGDGGTTCVDTTDDSNNCNSCGNKCPSGYFCKGGTCGLNCAGGTSLCGSACVDETIDNNHCGSCATTCTTGTGCSGGHCCPTATPVYCAAESKCDTLLNCVLKSGGGITAGQSHTCAINPTGNLYCWGTNSNGELGIGSTAAKNTAQPVSLSSVVGVSAWYYGACATLSSGGEYCWGYNADGWLGNSTYTSSTSPVQVTGITNGILPAGGGYYGANCVLKSGGGISCWGYDEYGDVGLGSITYSTYNAPKATSISNVVTFAGTGLAFENMHCAVFTSGSVGCWGYGDYDLGDGSTYDSGTPVTVTGISNAASVAVGADNTCIVMKDGTMKCWGDDYYGELGDGSSLTSSLTPVGASLSGIAQACVGAEHTCVVTTAGAVKCIGYNGNGQLGNGTTSSSATTTWQTAISSGAASVACGSSHTCAILATGKAQCWGYNGSGQLGDGTNTQRTSPVAVSGF